MATPYESEQIITTSANDEIVAVPCPGRCFLTRVAAARLDDVNGTTTLTLFSRAFTSDTVKILRITEGGISPSSLASGPSSSTVFTLAAPLVVKVGDYVTFAGAMGYDGTARVLSISADCRTVDVDWLFGGAQDVEAGSATLQLDIPSAQQPLYLVTPSLTGAGFAEEWPDADFFNQDPLPTVPEAGRNIGVNRKIYIKFDEAGAYKLILRASISVALGD